MSTNSYTKTRFSANDTALAKRCSGMQGNSPCVRRNGCRGTTARRWRMHHLGDKIMHGRKRSYAAV